MDKPRETKGNNEIPREEEQFDDTKTSDWLTQEEIEELKSLDNKVGITHIERAKRGKLLTMASMRKNHARGKKYTAEDDKVLSANNRLLEINYTSDIENFKKE